MSVSSSGSGEIPTMGHYPLLVPKADASKKTDHLKIGSIVAAAIGGLIIALVVVSYMKLLPTDIFESVGIVGKMVTLIVGASIFAPAAYILIDKWLDSRTTKKTN